MNKNPFNVFYSLLFKVITSVAVKFMLKNR